jgi:hypothetical protein
MKTSFKPALLVLLLTVCGLQVQSVLARASILTEQEYWAFMQESRAIVARLENEPAEKILQELDQLAARWEAVTEVEVDGERIPLDHQYLTELMRSDPPDLDLLEKTLASFLEVRLGAPAGVFSPADLMPLTEILARPEFQWAEAAPNPAAEWLQKLLAEINRWINKILGVTFDVASLDMIPYVMVVALAVVFVFIFRTLFSDFLNEAQLNENGEEEPLTSEAAFAKAQQLSRGGDYRAAVRYLYLSTLLILDERGVMRYDRSKTNREYLRSVSNSPELSKPLGEVIEVFDNVWYGNHALEEESFQHYSKRVEELKEKQP